MTSKVIINSHSLSFRRFINKVDNILGIIFSGRDTKEVENHASFMMLYAKITPQVLTLIVTELLIYSRRR